MDMRKLVGRNVKRVKQDKGLTQEQLAERSGFSQQYISGLEQGRRNPTIVSIYELATALGVSYMEARALCRRRVALAFQEIARSRLEIWSGACDDIPALNSRKLG